MPEPFIVFAGQSATRVSPDRQLLLHCHPHDAAVIGGAIGLTLGDALLASATTGGWSALHLSPDEWLLIGPTAAEADLAGRLAATGLPASLVDVSDRSLAIDLAGPDVIDWLAGGCPLDLERLPDGACTRTLFGKATVMLWRRGDGWRLSSARSFDDYVTALLAAIAQDLASERTVSA